MQELVIKQSLHSTVKNVLNLNSLVVHDWLRAVFQIEDPDPYLLSHGGQTRHDIGPVQFLVP